MHILRLLVFELKLLLNASRKNYNENLQSVSHVLSWLCTQIIWNCITIELASWEHFEGNAGASPTSCVCMCTWKRRPLLVCVVCVWCCEIYGRGSVVMMVMLSGALIFSKKNKGWWCAPQPSLYFMYGVLIPHGGGVRARAHSTLSSHPYIPP